MSLLLADLKRKAEVFADDGAPISLLRVLVTDGTSANVLYRSMNFCQQYRLSPLALVFQFLNKLINGCVIGASANFDQGFVIMHPSGIVINSAVKGGINVTLESGVVIGAEKGYTPVLGDNIFIGAGAKIIGGITVGDGAKVGANAVVVHDVEPGQTVVGIPAKPIKKRIT